MYIYIITNKIDGKKYIGQTTRNDPMERINEHFRDQILSSPYLYNTIQKHGKENFDIEIISYLGASQEALDAIEQWQIKKNNSLHPNGYNLETGGKGRGSVSDETRKRMSEAQSGEKHHLYGKEHSIETRKKMSRAKSGEKHPLYGKKHTEEAKKKMRGSRLSMKGKNNPMYGKTGKKHQAWDHICEIVRLRFEERKTYQYIANIYDCGPTLIETICKSI